ncbi:hypothetical protein RB601_008283 [Gaeumannomyces tritici]
MPPVKNTGPPFKEEERVFCFHMDMLYEARILEVQAAEAGEGPAGGWQYKIHYKGWKNTWDDWVPQDRVRKFNDENKELASQLREQMKSQQKGSKAAASAGAKRAARGATGAAAANGGSDFSSLRGSEERTAAHTTSSGRGPRRARDYDLEQVTTPPKRSWAEEFAAKEARLAKNANARSHLSRLPPPDLKYVDRGGRFLWGTDTRFCPRPPPRQRRKGRHPKLSGKKESGNLTDLLEAYWQELPDHVNVPLAGLPRPDHLFRRIRKLGRRMLDPLEALPASAEGDEFQLAPELLQSWEQLPSPPPHPEDQRQRLAATLEEGSQNQPAISSEEENFQNRPSIKLVMPDHLKAMLVDDWENITKNQQLVPIPHPHPFDNIVKDYVEWELPHRPDDSAEKDLLEETMSGLREYFNKALGRILLYKFERTQYLEIREQWESPSEGGHKCVADTYGAEHLLRLLVSLPELVAQTNMDQQSVNRLREEISKFTNWLAKNYAKYFVSEYETPAQDYIEKARSS